MKIFLTGGTGSFGYAFIADALKNPDVEVVTVYSRDEMKHWKLVHDFTDKRVRSVIGDVRDAGRLRDALVDHDIVVHAAATKIVHLAEINASECIKTNIDGALNLIEACKKCDVKTVVALSTDKASNPVNLYGASKLASDKLFVAANLNSSIPFSIVRYGNVVGSRGSIIPLFNKLIAEGRKSLPLTDPRMTRFVIDLREAVDLVWRAIDEARGGEVYVKKIPSVRIVDVIRAYGVDEYEVIGIRPGEKLHEQMIGSDEAHFTYEYPDHYRVLPSLLVGDTRFHLMEGSGKKVSDDFVYSSDSNSSFLNAHEFLSRFSKMIRADFD